MSRTAVTPSPGFISIQVSDVKRSSEFYERHLGAVRDTFDFGPDAVAYVGSPTAGLNAGRRPGQSGPSPETTTIALWWRASDAPALFETAPAAGVRTLAEPLDAPFGRTSPMAHPDGYRTTAYAQDRP